MTLVRQLDLGIIVLGVAVAIALATVGLMRLFKIGFALRERGAGYGDLPIHAYVERLRRKLGPASRSVAGATVLAYRARVALAEIHIAQAKLAAVAGSPRALRRLGTLIVTGR